MQPPFVILELSLGALQFRSSLCKRGASFRGSGFGRGVRFLQILDALRQVLVPDRERVAVERHGGVLSPQAFVCFAQALELALRIEVGDFRSLDLDERLINRTQGLVELRTDGLDIAERELNAVEVCAQTFVAPANRVESARDFQRLRFPMSALIAGGEGAQTGDDGTGTCGGVVVPRLVTKCEGPQVVRRRRVVLEQLFPTHGHGDVPLIYLKRPPKVTKNTTDHGNISSL